MERGKQGGVPEDAPVMIAVLVKLAWDMPTVNTV